LILIEFGYQVLKREFNPIFTKFKLPKVLSPSELIGGSTYVVVGLGRVGGVGAVGSGHGDQSGEDEELKMLEKIY
jgi:hypothetical protein